MIHEASNSGLQQRAGGVKSVLGSGGVKILTIPNAKSDIPGTKAKVQAAFKADKHLDGFLGLDLKGANNRVAALLSNAWEDRRHGLVVSVPRGAGSARRGSCVAVAACR